MLYNYAQSDHNCYVLQAHINTIFKFFKAVDLDNKEECEDTKQGQSMTTRGKMCT